MATLAKLETLSTAQDALLRVGAFEVAPREYIRASNRLLDACLGTGMSANEPDHETWAAVRVARWLMEA